MEVAGVPVWVTLTWVRGRKARIGVVADPVKARVLREELVPATDPRPYKQKGIATS